jgi:hypothetical protein
MRAHPAKTAQEQAKPAVSREIPPGAPAVRIPVAVLVMASNGGRFGRIRRVRHSRAREIRREAVGRVALRAGNHVAITVQGGPNIAMPSPRADLFEIEAGRDEE